MEAALETLKREGFAGASARSIARTGGFNQALVFYHFGSVNDLLVAALDETSARRMQRYRAAVEGVGSLSELLQVATSIYREDLESGHVKVLAELISASSASPELGPKIVERIEPWIRFTEEALARVLAGSPFERLVSARDLAFAVVGLYLGVELLSHLEGSGAAAERLMESAGRLMPLAEGLFGPITGSS